MANPRLFKAVVSSTNRPHVPRLSWPQCEVRDEEIVISSYPFAYSSVFPGNVRIPVTRLTAIFHSISDAAFVLDGKEIIFLQKELKPALEAFAERHHIPSPPIQEVWSDLAEPYIDQPYTSEQEAKDFQSLAERGFEAKEVRTLRRRIANTMVAATFFTFEWVLYTTQDVLRAFALMSPKEFTDELYWEMMEVALRPYRKVDPEAAPRMRRLKGFWDTAWSELHLVPPPGLYARVAGRYLEPHRSYHTLRHLEECFASYEAAKALCANPGEVLLALWFHDVVYRPKAHDNEQASARWARKILSDAGASSEVSARVHELILATKHDATPASADARVLVDIDLSVANVPPPGSS